MLLSDIKRKFRGVSNLSRSQYKYFIKTFTTIFILLYSNNIGNSCYNLYPRKDLIKSLISRAAITLLKGPLS